MDTLRKRQEGMALVLVVIAAIVILAATGLVVQRVYSSKRLTEAAISRTSLDEICKAGVDLGIERIWNRFRQSADFGVGNMAAFDTFIDKVVADSPAPPGPPTRVDLLEGAPYNLPSGGRVTQVMLSRNDDGTGSDLTFEITGEVAGQTRTATQTVRVAGRQFRGFEYAVLANNVNCILCHAEVLNARLEYNTDSNAYNSFDRVKAATLESLLVRPSEADSVFSGSLFTRGQIYNNSGGLMGTADIISSTLDGSQIWGDLPYAPSSSPNAGPGHIVQDATSGAKTEIDLGNPLVNYDGSTSNIANFHSNYPSAEADMMDGYLPQSFPSPFPDDNQDRIIDSSEFQGFVSEEHDELGTLSGGIAYGIGGTGVPATYGLTGLPTASNAAASDVADGSYSGNLVLVGTDSNPIVINGKVAIDGDLVITGKVQGAGILQVRRNTYVVGDVTYADGSGPFGGSESDPNLLAIASGGSILMGDYVTVRGRNHSKDTTKYPDIDYSIDVRTRNKTATQKIGTKTETLNIGYFDTGVVDPGGPTYNADGTIKSKSGGYQTSFTTSELMLFNNLEMEKAAADPNYKPRLYGLRDSQPNNVWWYDSADEHTVRYDEAGGTVKKVSASMLARATEHYMNPQGNWISEDKLREIWWNDEQARPARQPWRFDGLLYSSNAIFAITRSETRHHSNTWGRMRLRGGIVCADLGVLVPSNVDGAPGLTLLYDERVGDFLQIEDTTQVGLTRLVFMYDTNS